MLKAGNYCSNCHYYSDQHRLLSLMPRSCMETTGVQACIFLTVCKVFSDWTRWRDKCQCKQVHESVFVPKKDCLQWTRQVLSPLTTVPITLVEAWPRNFVWERRGRNWWRTERLVPYQIHFTFDWNRTTHNPYSVQFKSVHCTCSKVERTWWGN